jgi:hypothetical protein
MPNSRPFVRPPSNLQLVANSRWRRYAIRFPRQPHHHTVLCSGCRTPISPITRSRDWHSYSTWCSIFNCAGYEDHNADFERGDQLFDMYMCGTCSSAERVQRAVAVAAQQASAGYQYRTED